MLTIRKIVSLLAIFYSKKKEKIIPKEMKTNKLYVFAITYIEYEY